MTTMNRTLLGVALSAIVVVPVGFVYDLDRLGDWGLTGAAILTGLLITLFDRDAFYGPRSERHG